MVGGMERQDGRPRLHAEAAWRRAWRYCLFREVTSRGHLDEFRQEVSVSAPQVQDHQSGQVAPPAQRVEAQALAFSCGVPIHGGLAAAPMTPAVPTAAHAAG